MKRGLLIVLLSLAAGFSSETSAKQESARYHNRLEPLVAEFVQEEHVPGLAIVVVEHGKVAYAHGFGVTELGAKGHPVTPKTIFHIASVTKPFVATAMMQLAERGAVSLDTPIVRYLPYFRLADDRSGSITAREILTHSSGIPDVADYEWDRPQYDDQALERYVRGLKTVHLLFAPGARFSYSNMAFDILGDLIAKVSGESFEAYVQEHLLAPLGMTGSTLLTSAADPERLARGHEEGADGSIAVSRVFPDNRIHSPSSNMLTCADDMARWAIANMQHGVLDGKRILADSTYEHMWTPSAVGTKRSNWRYKRGLGLCWVLGEYQGHPVVWHAGGDEGFVADCVMLPDVGIAVVWMMNADWPKRVTLTEQALDVALDRKIE